MTRPPNLSVLHGGRDDPMDAYRRAEAETVKFAQEVADNLIRDAWELARRLLEVNLEPQVKMRLTPAQADFIHRTGTRLKADLERLAQIEGRR